MIHQKSKGVESRRRLNTNLWASGYRPSPQRGFRAQRRSPRAGRWRASHCRWTSISEPGYRSRNQANLCLFLTVTAFSLEISFSAFSCKSIVLCCLDHIWMVTKPDFVKSGSSREVPLSIEKNILKRRSLAFRSLFTSTQKEKEKWRIWSWFAMFPKIPSIRTILRCVTLLSGMKPVDNGFREMLWFKTRQWTSWL